MYSIIDIIFFSFMAFVYIKEANFESDFYAHKNLLSYFSFFMIGYCVLANLIVHFTQFAYESSRTYIGTKFFNYFLQVIFWTIYFYVHIPDLTIKNDNFTMWTIYYVSIGMIMIVYGGLQIHQIRSQKRKKHYLID